MEEQKNSVLKIFKEYFILSFGVFLVAVGVHFFKFPNNISTGGVTGLAVVLNQIIPGLSASNIVTILNTLLLAFGFIYLGRDFGIKTVFGSFLLSAFLELFDCVIPVSSPLTGEPMLELLYAVALPSAGAAVLFYHHGSTGGTDILAMIIRKKTNLDSGKALLCADILCVVATFWDFGNSKPALQTGLLSTLGLILKSVVVDNLLENLNQSKKFFVVTTHKKEVEDYIIDVLHRSATVWECEGSFSHEREYAFVTVMNRYQAFRLRSYIKKIDPKSFVIVTNTSDIIGKGFRQI